MCLNFHFLCVCPRVVDGGFGRWTEGNLFMCVGKIVDVYSYNSHKAPTFQEIVSRGYGRSLMVICDQGEVTRGVGGQIP